MAKQFRQGDVLFMEIPKTQVPKYMYEKEDGVIIEGEATGHAHRLVGGILFDCYGRFFIRAEKTAKVVHEEHGTITLPPAYYRVVLQREYDEVNESRLVLD